MKKLILLFLTLLSFASYGQAEYEKLKITENIKQNSASRVIVQDSTSQELNWRLLSHMPISNPVRDSLSKKLNLPTGFLQGLQLSINADPTKYNIAAGYYVVTDFTNLAQPVVKIIAYPGATGLSPAYLASANSTYIALDKNMNVVSSVSPFTDADRRTLAIIGNVVHSNNTTINVTNEIKAPIVAIGNQLHDFMKAIGFLNESGNIYAPNGANLQINKSVGDIFGMGINSADYLKPHKLTIPAQTGLTFAYRLQGGTQYANTVNIDPNNYDNGNVLTSMPVGSRWQIQRINLFQSGLTRVQYGQTVYTSFNAAVIALPTQSFVTEQNIADNSIFRCYLIVQQGTTDLASAVAGGTAQFIPVDKFGNVIGNGSVALTYANIIAALGYTPENVANKQNSLAVDGTGQKYPTVDAVNAAIPVNYSKIVYVNNVNPNSATIFDLENPPTINDNALKTDTANLYIGTDASTWVYNGSIYITKSVTSDTSNFWYKGTTVPAGNSKTATLTRNGGAEFLASAGTGVYGYSYGNTGVSSISDQSIGLYAGTVNGSKIASFNFGVVEKAAISAAGNVTANAIDTNTTKITITTSVSITTATLDANGIRQDGRHVVIDNGVNVINLTCNGGVTASYGKVGTGAITFVQGSGRTLVQMSGTAVFNGIAGSTATLWSNGTTDYLAINNY